MGYETVSFLSGVTPRSVVDPRAYRVSVYIGEDVLLARHVVDDFGNLVRVSEWCAV